MFQPTTFGNYFLTRRIAVGGMAEVYAAKLYGADGFEKDIVIKQILPQYARDPEFVQSFVAEAKIAVTLSHANIVGIYELGRVDGTYFIAMELVDGLDVYSLVDTAKRAGELVDVGMAVYIVEEVAKGLDYAHRKLGPDAKPLGLVHRDLSPRNVLLSREGEVKILDFGIAKTRSELAAMPKTRAGVVKGTSGYMSPEQATGGDVDARTDVYQAGLLLFELLTGEALFWRPDDEQTRELMRKHRVYRPSEVAADIPEELDRVVLAALARDPAKRIQTAADLAGFLTRIRLMRYPKAGPRVLGELVVKMSEREAEQERAAMEVLPSTQELRETAGIVETIATRAPSMPGKKPLGNGASQVAMPEVQAVEPPPAPPKSIEPPPAEPPATAEVASSNVVAAQPETALPQIKRSPPLAMLFGAAAIAGSLAGLGFMLSTSDPPRANPKPIAAAVIPAPEPVRSTTATIATQVATQPEVRIEPVKKKAIDKQPTSVTTQTAQVATGYATVAFGTRSCSSRVTVDGKIIARSTPSYDHKLSAGTHTISIEGTSCPPIERPGSLRSAIPTVVKELKLEAGASLKIIADFEHETMTVRE